MNTREIIESGKIELYVCGALSEREMREISLLADLNTDLREEIARVENNLVNYAESFDQAPGQATLNKILKNIKAGNKTFQVDFRSNTLNYGYIASIVGVILVSLLSFYFWKQTQILHQRIDALTPLQDTITNLKTVITQQNSQLEFLNRTTTRKYKLVGVEGKDSNDNFVLVYWCQPTHEIAITPGNLSTPPAGMVYQLWAMNDGKAVSVGILDMNAVQAIGRADRADAFCITMEKAGGASQPTMEALVLLRKV